MCVRPGKPINGDLHIFNPFVVHLLVSKSTWSRFANNIFQLTIFDTRLILFLLHERYKGHTFIIPYNHNHKLQPNWSLFCQCHSSSFLLLMITILLHLRLVNRTRSHTMVLLVYPCQVENRWTLQFSNGKRCRKQKPVSGRPSRWWRSWTEGRPSRLKEQHSKAHQQIVLWLAKILIFVRSSHWNNSTEDHPELGQPPPNHVFKAA